MIPATAITFNADSTAWLVIGPGTPLGWQISNRPCDTCKGTGLAIWNGCGTQPDCPSCHGTGRHCFEIAVPRDLLPFRDGIHQGRTRPLRVYVLDIVPIVEVDKHNTVGRYIVQMPRTKRTWLMDNSEFPVKQEEVTLPDDAKPGDWATHLKVVT